MHNLLGAKHSQILVRATEVLRDQRYRNDPEAGEQHDQILQLLGRLPQSRIEFKQMATLVLNDLLPANEALLTSRRELDEAVAEVRDAIQRRNEQRATCQAAKQRIAEAMVARDAYLNSDSVTPEGAREAVKRVDSATMAKARADDELRCAEQRLSVVKISRILKKTAHGKRQKEANTAREEIIQEREDAEEATNVPSARKQARTQLDEQMGDGELS